MADPTDLDTLRDRVEQILMDSGNAIWATTDIDAAIRQALAEYSKIRALHTEDTVDADADTHELDVSTELAGALDVTRVWCPYTAAAPEDPPAWVDFEFWRDELILYLPGGIQSGETARVFFDAVQTLGGLDSATDTTLPAEDWPLIATGAAGYAAMSRALDLGEQVTLDRDVPTKAKTWAGQKLQDFRQGLASVARAEALHGHSHVPLPKLDRHDSTWS
jgi:hypothetical protein